MKVRIAIGLTLFAWSAVDAQSPARATRASTINVFRERYATTMRELPSYRAYTADMDSLGIERRSVEGGEVHAHCKGTELRLVEVIDNGEYGQWTSGFYYWHGELYFTHIVSEQRELLYGPTVATTEERLYFNDAELIRWLGPGNRVRALDTPAARERSIAVAKEARQFFSLVGTCEKAR